jgi:Ca2+-binding EF-hand superfamily protein
MNYFNELLSIAVLYLLVIGTVAQQKVAPGVPPQHYQGNPQQVQYHHQQQQQQHYQQPQVQYQQHVPQVNPEVYQHQQMVDPIYQQVPQGQVPIQHHEQIPQQQQYQQPHGHQQQQPHGHQQQQPHSHQQNVPHSAGGHHQQQVLNAANIQHEKEHIAEHLEVPIDTSKMTDQELQFHYFKMHDADHNNKLDGCELIKSLIHWHAQGKHGDHQTNAPNVEEKIFSDEELTALIDPILQSDDISKDGYIDYPEFIRAQQKTAAGR